jgi:hypothetical protein
VSLGPLGAAWVSASTATTAAAESAWASSTWASVAWSAAGLALALALVVLGAHVAYYATKHHGLARAWSKSVARKGSWTASVRVTIGPTF